MLMLPVHLQWKRLLLGCTSRLRRCRILILGASLGRRRRRRVMRRRRGMGRLQGGGVGGRGSKAEAGAGAGRRGRGSGSGGSSGSVSRRRAECNIDGIMHGWEFTTLAASCDYCDTVQQCDAWQLHHRQGSFSSKLSEGPHVRVLKPQSVQFASCCRGCCHRCGMKLFREWPVATSYMLCQACSHKFDEKPVKSVLHQGMNVRECGEERGLTDGQARVGRAHRSTRRRRSHSW